MDGEDVDGVTDGDNPVVGVSERVGVLDVVTDGVVVGVTGGLDGVAVLVIDGVTDTCCDADTLGVTGTAPSYAIASNILMFLITYLSGY